MCVFLSVPRLFPFAVLCIALPCVLVCGYEHVRACVLYCRGAELTLGTNMKWHMWLMLSFLFA